VLEVEKSSNVGGGLDYATTDGTHILGVDDGIRYLARDDRAVYMSEDGWAWRRVWQE
jgi:hypothetical protein